MQHRDRDPSARTRLTRQELRVASTVARGSTNREVAEALRLSPKTVEFHLSNVYAKLGVRSRTELAVLLAGRHPAFQNGRSRPRET